MVQQQQHLSLTGRFFSVFPEPVVTNATYDLLLFSLVAQSDAEFIIGQLMN